MCKPRRQSAQLKAYSKPQILRQLLLLSEHLTKFYTAADGEQPGKGGSCKACPVLTKSDASAFTACTEIRCYRKRTCGLLSSARTVCVFLSHKYCCCNKAGTVLCLYRVTSSSQWLPAG